MFTLMSSGHHLFWLGQREGLWERLHRNMEETEKYRKQKISNAFTYKKNKQNHVTCECVGEREETHTWLKSAGTVQKKAADISGT